jgi:uncharacterized protein
MDNPRKNTVTFRFYEELNDHLKYSLQKKEIPYTFGIGQTVKDAVEKLGIPHCEIDLIVVNGESVNFEYRLSEGDYISVYPVFETLDISPVVRLRPEPLRIIRFILDAHLGKLARMLRLLGFDSLYRNDFEDDEVVRLASKERRIILTRDRGLLMHRKVTHGYFLRNINPDRQLTEVVNRFRLRSLLKPFARCALCNGEIENVAKESVLTQLPRNTARYYDEFYICNSCGQVYWKGSHYAKLMKRIQGLGDLG